MNMRLFFIIILIVVSCIVSLFFVPNQYRKIIITLTVAACLVLGGIFCAYIFNPKFGNDMNMLFGNYQTQHTATLENTAYYVPLPSKTIFNFRFSDAGANYITKSNVNEITSFYSNIATPNSFLNITENEISHLSFSYEENEFEVTIKKNENKKNYYLTVDLMNEEH